MRFEQTPKQVVWSFWQQIVRVTPDQSDQVMSAFVHEATAWNGPHPINALHGRSELLHGFWQPLRHAFPDLRRRTDIFLGGMFNGQDWVCGTGYFIGRWANNWLGIPATGQTAHIRFGEFCRIENGQIAETYILLDLVALLLEAGIRVLPPCLGDEGLIPPPRTGDGVLLTPQEAAATQQSLQLVEAMIGGLMRYDGVTISSMEMPRYWHPHMHWYGPCGIGTARSLSEYEHVHARPFLHAFPDRKGGNHKARLAEGVYVASTGWPSVRATHAGSWLGAPATQKPIGMRVMDWWRREDELLAENWVFIDMIDLFLQFGIDLFDRIEK